MRLLPLREYTKKQYSFEEKLTDHVRSVVSLKASISTSYRYVTSTVSASEAAGAHTRRVVGRGTEATGDRVGAMDDPSSSSIMVMFCKCRVVRMLLWASRRSTKETKNEQTKQSSQTARERPCNAKVRRRNKSTRTRGRGIFLKQAKNPTPSIRWSIEFSVEGAAHYG